MSYSMEGTNFGWRALLVDFFFYVCDNDKLN